MKGKIKFDIAGQEALPKAMQNLLRKALDNGDGADQSLRHQCRIAEDAKRVFAGIEIAGDEYSINPKATPQFGRDYHGLAYLTVSLIRKSDDSRVQIRWEGEAVPRKMQEVAVKHDEGRKVAPTVVSLDLGAATIREVDQRTPAREAAKRNYEQRQRETNGGVPRTTLASRKPRYGRLCAADLSVSA